MGFNSGFKGLIIQAITINKAISPIRLDKQSTYQHHKTSHSDNKLPTIRKQTQLESGIYELCYELVVVEISKAMTFQVLVYGVRFHSYS